MTFSSPFRALAVALLAGAPVLASAVSLAEGKLFLNGNGQWSYQATSRAGTAYLEADSGGDWQTAMFDLLAVAKPTEELTLNAQMGFEATGEVSLEWAFMEWKLSDALRIRAGKVKQPFGNYAELQFVGTGRPLYDLPTSIYGPAGIVADAYQGIGLTGDLPFGSGWNFQYDLWGGALKTATFEPFDWFNGETPTAAAPSIEEISVEYILGARASVTAPNGWTYRFSGYGGNADAGEGEKNVTYAAVAASAWYRGEKLWLSAEASYGPDKGYEKSAAGYLEAAWFLTEKVQVAGRYEILRADIEGLKGSDALGRHDGYTVGASYWISPGAVLRASVDYVKGTRFLRREAWDEAAETGTLIGIPTARTVGETFRFLVGTQFTF